MKPPIYMCDNGHCVCKNCEKKVNRCPTCREAFNASRNIGLEKITEHVSYPCKYNENGCNFYGKINELVNHEKSCTIIANTSKRCTCFVNFLKPCSWFGTIEKFGDHLKNTHNSQLLKIGALIEYKFTEENKMYRFAYYDGEIFRSVVAVYGVTFKINVQKVSKIRKREYKFTVDFMKNENEVLVLTKKCGLNSMVINRVLMNENRIIFKLIITECH